MCGAPEDSGPETAPLPGMGPPGSGDSTVFPGPCIWGSGESRCFRAPASGAWELTLTSWPQKEKGRHRDPRRRGTSGEGRRLPQSPAPGSGKPIPAHPFWRAWVCGGTGLRGSPRVRVLQARVGRRRCVRVLRASCVGPRGPGCGHCPGGQLISLAAARRRQPSGSGQSCRVRLPASGNGGQGLC